MKEIKTYDSTPVSMLDNMHTMTGVEFDCKDGIVTEIDGSRRQRPEPPTGKGYGRFCDAEKRVLRNMIADADTERLNYIIGLMPTELLCEEVKRRDAKNKAVLSVVRQAIGV
jgi:hypothetical protein